MYMCVYFDGVLGCDSFYFVQVPFLFAPFPREKPLAFYVFTGCRANFERICSQTSSGSISHNDTLMYAGGKHTMSIEKGEQEKGKETKCCISSN